MEIRIDGWECNLTFSSAHFLADYSKCSRLHGHTYAVHTIIEGDLVNGLVIDFRIIKDILKKIAEELDHKVIIPTEGKFAIRKNGDVEVSYMEKRYVFPREECVFIPRYSSSAENLASYILEKVLEHMNADNIKGVKIGVDEGRGQGAWIQWEREQSA